MVVNIGMEKLTDGFTVRCSACGKLAEGATALYAAEAMTNHREVRHCDEDATLHYRFGIIGAGKGELEGRAWLSTIDPTGGHP